MASHMPILRCEAVAKLYGAASILEDLSIDVKSGEFLTLLGPSGCGKSTALNIIAGIVPPSSGKVILRGRDVTALPPRRRNLGFVFQSWALFPHMTAFENVAYGLKVRGVPESDIRLRVDEMLDIVRLSQASGRFPSQLSGGMQQRVALARALVSRPDLLLLDEPLSNLDAALRKEMQIEIRRIHNELNISTILVTHSQEEALVMSDRIAVMKNGRIEELGEPLEMYRAPQTPFVCTFLGEANILNGEVIGVEADNIMVRGGDTVLRMKKTNSAAIGENVSFSIRPESLRFATNGEAGENQIAVTVIDSIFVGNHFVFVLESGEHRFQMMALPSPDLSLHAGDRTNIQLPSDAIVVFERA